MPILMLIILIPCIHLYTGPTLVQTIVQWALRSWRFFSFRNYVSDHLEHSPLGRILWYSLLLTFAEDAILQVYMTYVQASQGGGGWPMSVFLTPELKPIVGGTYFPPDDKYGRPGFKTVLKWVHWERLYAWISDLWCNCMCNSMDNLEFFVSTEPLIFGSMLTWSSHWQNNWHYAECIMYIVFLDTRDFV